jgi:hypothetical protein
MCLLLLGLGRMNIHRMYVTFALFAPWFRIDVFSLHFLFKIFILQFLFSLGHFVPILAFIDLLKKRAN